MDLRPTLSAEETEEQDAQERQRKRDAAKLVSDYRRTFRTAHGQRVLYDLLAYCLWEPMQKPFEGSSRIYFDAGLRSVAVKLINVTDLGGKGAKRKFIEGWISTLAEAPTTEEERLDNE